MSGQGMTNLQLCPNIYEQTGFRNRLESWQILRVRIRAEKRIVEAVMYPRRMSLSW